MSFCWFVHQCSGLFNSNSVNRKCAMDGSRKIFLESGRQKVSTTRRARSQDRELRMEDRESPSSILYLLSSNIRWAFFSRLPSRMLKNPSESCRRSSGRTEGVEIIEDFPVHAEVLEAFRNLLGNGIGSIGQAQEIPDDQEHNADELRKRRRDMEQPAT